MLDAAIKALIQLFSRPFRTVLLKSVGLAIALGILYLGFRALEPKDGPT